jgi:hypothetical protein
MKSASIGLFGIFAVYALMLTPAPASAGDEEVPSFKRQSKDEKEFVRSVGTAIVKAARSAPKDIMLESYEYEQLKGKRKDLKIKMSYKGGVTNKKFFADIVVKLDETDKAAIEVLNIDYKDNNNVSLGSPNVSKIQKLIEKFNQ